MGTAVDRYLSWHAVYRQAVDLNPHAPPVDHLLDYLDMLWSALSEEERRVATASLRASSQGSDTT